MRLVHSLFQVFMKLSNARSCFLSFLGFLFRGLSFVARGLLGFMSFLVEGAPDSASCLQGLQPFPPPPARTPPHPHSLLAFFRLSGLVSGLLGCFLGSFSRSTTPSASEKRVARIHQTRAMCRSRRFVCVCVPPLVLNELCLYKNCRGPEPGGGLRPAKTPPTWV